MTTASSTTSAGGAQSFKLSSCPPEVLELIAECVPEDLPSLRLASRECNLKTRCTFTSHFFTTLPIMLCYEESIATALEVAAHPVFGLAIRTLEVGLNVIPDDKDLERMSSERIRRVQKDDPSIAVLHKERQQMITDERDTRLLTALLVTLREAGKIQSVRLTAGGSDHDRLYDIFYPRMPGSRGLRLRQFKGRGGSWIRPYDHDVRTDALIKALSISQIHIQDLSVRDWPLPLDALNRESPTLLTHYSNVFSSLKHLNLAYCVYSEDGEEVGLLAELLAKANGMVTLKLNGNANSELLGTLAKEDLPHLRTLNIFQSTVTFAALENFVQGTGYPKIIELDKARLTEVPSGIILQGPHNFKPVIGGAEIRLKPGSRVVWKDGPGDIP
ncbi:hypothetical protein DOTSEDRAFT_57127 [Dothistroma septosporum NZE10]|uniref:F-box domain-containing protein n=1 Tax=Dothistroma septosporum (strain NZE10 / CBS 128990) TaxID=675120 RepID=M2YIJ7_DOTSN|nr:hypothetical protein DOTSEDRAFT_57127 [Dothistroma septosporum NZE10]